MAEESIKYTYNKSELKKLFTSFSLSAGGFIFISLIQLVLQVDFGETWNMLIAAMGGFAINAIRLFLQGKGITPLGKGK